METRRGTQEDALTLSTLNVDVQKIHADALPNIFKQPGSDDFAQQFMLERLADPLNYFIIARLDGEDIGYIYARIIDRLGNPFMHPWKYFYIEQISVKPGYQGRGYGESLIQAVRQAAQEQGIETIALDTWFFNKQAQSFFRKNGFVTFNERMWTSEK